MKIGLRQIMLKSK